MTESEKTATAFISRYEKALSRQFDFGKIAFAPNFLGVDVKKIASNIQRDEQGTPLMYLHTEMFGRQKKGLLVTSEKVIYHPNERKRSVVDFVSLATAKYSSENYSWNLGDGITVSDPFFFDTRWYSKPIGALKALAQGFLDPDSKNTEEFDSEPPVQLLTNCWSLKAKDSMKKECSGAVILSDTGVFFLYVGRNRMFSDLLAGVTGNLIGGAIGGIVGSAGTIELTSSKLAIPEDIVSFEYHERPDIYKDNLFWDLAIVDAECFDSGGRIGNNPTAQEYESSIVIFVPKKRILDVNVKGFRTRRHVEFRTEQISFSALILKPKEETEARLGAFGYS